MLQLSSTSKPTVTRSNGGLQTQKNGASTKARALQTAFLGPKAQRRVQEGGFSELGRRWFRLRLVSEREGEREGESLRGEILNRDP